MAREDKLAHFFLDKFKLNGLVDVESIHLRLMWRNNNLGEEGVSKCLNHFLAHHLLIKYIRSYHSWVGYVRCSDHFPIFVELGHSKDNHGSPFKYNPLLENLEESRRTRLLFILTKMFQLVHILS
jgi:hypothetical protein